LLLWRVRFDHAAHKRIKHDRFPSLHFGSTSLLQHVGQRHRRLRLPGFGLSRLLLTSLPDKLT
jgi:hypothetical protein